MTDPRVEAFLADVLALEVKTCAIRDGVHVALADCEQIFKAQKANRRMLPRVDKERGLFAERLGGLQSVQTLDKYETRCPP